MTSQPETHLRAQADLREARPLARRLRSEQRTLTSQTRNGSPIGGRPTNDPSLDQISPSHTSAEHSSESNDQFPLKGKPSAVFITKARMMLARPVSVTLIPAKPPQSKPPQPKTIIAPKNRMYPPTLAPGRRVAPKAKRKIVPKSKGIPGRPTQINIPAAGRPKRPSVVAKVVPKPPKAVLPKRVLPSSAVVKVPPKRVLPLKVVAKVRPKSSSAIAKVPPKRVLPLKVIAKVPPKRVSPSSVVAKVLPKPSKAIGNRAKTPLKFIPKVRVVDRTGRVGKTQIKPKVIPKAKVNKTF